MTFGTFLIFLLCLLALALAYFPRHINEDGRKIIGVIVLVITVVWVLGFFHVLAIGVR